MRRDLAQVDVGLEQPEQLEHLLVGVAAGGGVGAVEVLEAVALGLRRADRLRARQRIEAQVADLLDAALDRGDRRRRLGLGGFGAAGLSSESNAKPATSRIASSDEPTVKGVLIAPQCVACAAMADRAALVTGASSGIGLAIAHMLGEEGHGLTVAARRPEKLDGRGAGAARRRLRGRGGRRPT